MKTLRYLLSLFAAVILTGSNLSTAQTVNLYPTATVTDGMAWCINMPVYGYVTYHLTYHIDKKTGFVDRMHANVHRAELYLSGTGERLVYLDTGNDNSGVSWSFWNDPSMGGTNTFFYDREKYDVPIGELPAKGGNIWAVFRLITPGGEKYTMRSISRFILNSGGEPEMVFSRETIDCND